MQFIKEGVVRVSQANGLSQDLKKLRIFLFDSLLLCASFPNAYSFSVVLEVPLSDVVVHDVEDSGTT